MIMIKGKIHQEDITVITIYAPNMGTSKYIKQKLKKQGSMMETVKCQCIIINLLKIQK